MPTGCATVRGFSAMAWPIWLVLLLCASTTTASADGSWSLKGELGVEGSVFEGDSEPATEEMGLGLAGRLEAKRANGSFYQRLRLFGRTDAFDSRRSSAIIEEAWVEYRRGRWGWRAGVELFNWSATEAFHPADVINSRNFDSDLKSFEKLGEPMVGAIARIPRGQISVFYLPLHLDPKFPSSQSRLSFAPPGWRIRSPVWIDRNGREDEDRFADQWLVRVLQTWGPADVDLHVLRHFDRSQPVVIAHPERQEVVPIYLPLTQVGCTVQAVLDSWVVKLEWAHRAFEGGSYFRQGTLVGLDQPDHWQLAWGLEYGRSTAGGGSGALFLEAQSLFGPSKTERSDLSPFQRDVHFGYRHDFNDIPGRQITATFIVDMERSRERLLSIEYSQRLGNSWGLEAPVKAEVPVGLERLDGANRIRFTLRRRF